MEVTDRHIDESLALYNYSYKHESISGGPTYTILFSNYNGLRYS